MNNEHANNSKNLYLSSFWFTIKDIIATSFLSVYLLKLNATNWEMSLYEAIQGGLGVIVLLFFTVYLDNSRKTFLKIVGLERLSFFIFSLTLLFVKNPLVVILLYGLYYAVFNLAGPLSPNYMKEAIPKEDWGKVFSTNKMVLVAGNMATLFITGKLLDHFNYKFPYNFIVLFLAAGVSYWISYFFIRNIKADITSAKASIGRIELLRHVDKNLLLVLLSYVFIYMLGPLWAIYHVRELGFTNFQVAMLSTVYYLGGIVVLPLWGRLLQKFPVRKLFVVSVFLMAAIPLYYMVSKSFYYLLFAQLITGFFANGFEVITQNSLMESAQGMKYDYAYLSNFQIYTGVLRVIFPALGMLLYSHIGMFGAFMIIGGLRLTAGVLIWYFNKDEETALLDLSIEG